MFLKRATVMELHTEEFMFFASAKVAELREKNKNSFALSIN